MNTAAGPAGELRATNNITAFFSDIRLKDKIQHINNSQFILDNINGYYFTQNKYAENFGYRNYTKQVGVIAQEVLDVLPEIVELAPFDTNEYGESKSGENYLTINYKLLIPVLIEVAKEHQEEINFLKTKIINV